MVVSGMGILSNFAKILFGSMHALFVELFIWYHHKIKLGDKSKDLFGMLLWCTCFLSGLWNIFCLRVGGHAPTPFGFSYILVVPILRERASN